MADTGAGTRATGERGQATPLVALLFVIVAGALVALGHLGAVVADRNRAQTAADATALAGATDGEGRARDVAARNGGEVRSYVAQGADVEVVVRVGRAEASARARAGWGDR
jgi:Flp pilus assembly protein TadG